MKQNKTIKGMVAGVCIVAMVWAFCPAARADRPLERQEILNIFETLTGRPAMTWIRSGTIAARHEQYKAGKTADETVISAAVQAKTEEYLAGTDEPQLAAELQVKMIAATPFNVRYELSNTYTMISTETVRYDGSRFYWEIDVESRVDSVQVPPELERNMLTEEYDLDWNRKRVFAWDGEKYTNYFRPGNHAIISASPSGVNGPLTAGVVPWGHGLYSMEKLSATKATGYETESDGLTEIHLSVSRDSKEETFVLDPAKGYALLLYSVSSADKMIVRNYDKYQSVQGKLCPGAITITQYDTTADSQKVLSRDVWTYTSISAAPLEETSFKVQFEYNALIEDLRFGESLQYRYLPPTDPAAKNIDLDKLLEMRLEILFAADSAARNCATAALKRVCTELGLAPSWQELGRLVHGPRKSTSMLEMQQFLKGAGLNCLAVKTDLQTLRALGNQQAILHLPGQDHYVVLGNVGDKYVSLIDLDRDNFYYRRSIEYLDRVWDHTALLVDNRPIAMGQNYSLIGNDVLHGILGALCGGTCTRFIQGAAEGKCKSPSPGWCGGTHRIYYERWGCNGGTGDCDESTMIRMEWEACINDPNDPNGIRCIGDGNWGALNVSACM